MSSVEFIAVMLKDDGAILWWKKSKCPAASL